MTKEEIKALEKELQELNKVVEFLEENNIHAIDVERLRRRINEIEVLLLMEEGGYELIW